MRSFRLLAATVLFQAYSFSQPLPGTAPLTSRGDPVADMIAGMERIAERRTVQLKASRRPSRERLAYILGVREQRSGIFPELTAISSDLQPVPIRWPVFAGLTGEGFHIPPKGKARARVVVIPDATGEGVEQIAPSLAAAGAQVIVPVLMDRSARWSGNPAIRLTNIPHREFLHRMTWPVGRSITGYEVQKILAVVDWFKKLGPEPIGIYGYGEGGRLALFAAALDNRIAATVVSGYFGPRDNLWSEPLDRSVWSLLRDFGDAELAGMTSPRPLLIETRAGPQIAGPPPFTDRDRAAPGVLKPFSDADVRAEAARARHLALRVVDSATEVFHKSLGLTPMPAAPAKFDPSPILERQFREMAAYTQSLVEPAERARRKLWQDTLQIRRRFEAEIVPRLSPSGPARPRTRRSYASAKWTGYEVELDVMPDLRAYGVLLVPKGASPAKPRPLVVVQHGLDGRPQMLFQQREGRALVAYQNMGEKLANLGFYVYLPQNPYVGDFRRISRRAHPIGLSMFSFIAAQHQRSLEWLSTLPGVDPKRIGFYGLSYGGATALRIPPLIPEYSAVVCSGNFNEWIRKLITLDERYSYMFTHEYEILEWDLASIAGHAEMAMLIAPRPFLVERGHRDGVGIDEWVAYEYAKVRRYYAQRELAGRTGIAWFEGVHQMHGGEAIPFLRKWLRW